MESTQLKKCRSILGLDRPAMAKKLGMGLRTYVQRENGEMPIGPMMEMAVCWMLFVGGFMATIKRLNLGGIKKAIFGK